MEFNPELQINNIRDEEVSGENWKKICQYIGKLPSKVCELIYIIILDYYHNKSKEIPQEFLLGKKKKCIFITTENFDSELKKKILAFIKFINS